MGFLWLPFASDIRPGELAMTFYGWFIIELSFLLLSVIPAKARIYYYRYKGTAFTG